MTKSALLEHLPSGRSVIMVLLVTALVLWIIWVSLRLTQPNGQQIVQVHMSEIMRDFVDAEAKGDADPEVTRQEIARYLQATEAAVDDLGRSGHVILVAEAVLSKNTPDATLQLKTKIAQKLESASEEKPQ
ncbi:MULTISPECIES: TrbI F-type domain-containing protein [unclassified Sphingorhabdus]|uniref:TrbI F-type domain-containing protein n=1 Tax=unclassified Sphingorhabdus TaxID=2614947 RepID=UPI000B5CA8F9|nr:MULTISPECIES: TrbI F-type domain-containing protein [unclassified Sphingorhabdus]ASK87181.1 type-F conjugative transfer system protein (TrbI_Ftype) [Sphingorhabdus sp. SMR4y]VWX62308.1 Type-F conjugative transfer system protein (TrbI_Ftype) [Sphingorhabdus sp. 109]